VKVVFSGPTPNIALPGFTSNWSRAAGFLMTPLASGLEWGRNGALDLNGTQSASANGGEPKAEPGMGCLPIPMREWPRKHRAAGG
jgi:hypothetical protein